jgi:hypothetical protein
MELLLHVLYSICDATSLSDIYFVLCYVLSQYPNDANTGYEPGHIAILIIKLYSRNNHHMTNDIFLFITSRYYTQVGDYLNVCLLHYLGELL